MVYDAENGVVPRLRLQTECALSLGTAGGAAIGIHGEARTGIVEQRHLHHVQ